MAVHIDQESPQLPLFKHDNQPVGRADIAEWKINVVLQELTGDELTGDSLEFDHTVEHREFVRGLKLRFKVSLTPQAGHDADVTARACLQPQAGLELFRAVNLDIGGSNSAGTRIFKDTNQEFKNCNYIMKVVHDDKPDNHWQYGAYSKFYPKYTGKGTGNTIDDGTRVVLKADNSVTAAIGAYNINYGGVLQWDYPELSTECTAQCIAHFCTSAHAS